MFKRSSLLLVVIALGLSMAAPADAKLVVKGHVTHPYARWVKQSKMPVYTGRIVVTEHPCPGAAPGGCVNYVRRIIYAAHFPSGDARLDFYAALGQIFRQYVADSGRDFAHFQAIGHDHRPWFGPLTNTTTLTPDSPADQFAHAYAMCAINPRSPRKPAHVPALDWTFTGWRPTVRQHRAACRLFKAAFKRDQRGVTYSY